MKLTISNFGTRKHKCFLVQGKTDKINELVKRVNSQRLDYNMDYLDSDLATPGDSFAEFVTHRSDHDKAAAFIRQTMMDITKELKQNTVHS